MTKRYEEPIDQVHPALLLFLVDQSASMSDPASYQAGTTKAQAIADAVNRLIQELLFRCTVGNDIADRFYFGLIGYNSSDEGVPCLHPGFGGVLRERLAVPASQVGNNPLRIETRVKIVDDGAGGFVEQETKVPVWLEPVAQGQASMHAALELAKDSVAEFVRTFPESFPPIVINITDDESTDANYSDVVMLADALKSIANKNGSDTLLFNVFVSSRAGNPVLFPNLEEQLPDRWLSQLFRMASPLPDVLAANSGMPTGARGFICDGDPQSIFQVLNLDIRTGVEGNLACEAPARDVRAEVRDATKPPIRVDDNVQFTVYRPKSIRPKKWYPLLAYAHLDALPEDADKDEPEPTKAVQADAAKTLEAQLDKFTNTTQDSSHSVPREGELTFVPEMEGAAFNPTRQTIRWLENYHRVEFRVRSTPEYDGQTLRGRMSVFLGAILLAEVALRIKVDNSAEDNVEQAPRDTATAPRYRKIFASYSHRDLAIVEQFEKYVETLGDRYLRDWKELRSGEHWNNRLLQMIEEADVFQLFWSRNSMRSPFVRQEWEHALKLKHKGPSFVRPTYWEEPFPDSPAESLPPSELRQIQFTKLSVAPTTHGPLGPPLSADHSETRVTAPFARVDLSERPGDFRQISLEPGTPLLDCSSSHGRLSSSRGRLLRVWLGRFVAEPEWVDARSVQFYLNDDQDHRVDPDRLRPVSVPELQRGLQREVVALREKLAQIKPRGPTEQKIAMVIRDCFEKLLRDPTQGCAEGALFHYQDAQEQLRLVWCWGYQRAALVLAQPVLCHQPDCRRVYLWRSGTEALCPKCGAPNPDYRFPWRKVLVIAACLLIALVAGGWWYWRTLP